jgi:Mce-associated membrane protein
MMGSMTERDEQQRTTMEEDMAARTMATIPRLDAPEAVGTNDPVTTIDDTRPADTHPADTNASAVATATERKRYDATRTRIAAGVAGLVIVALLVAVVITRLQLDHKNATTHAGTTAVAAAKVYAVELASYDYRHLSQDFGAVQKHASPSFAKSFIQSSDALKTVLTKYKATAKAKVIAAGLTSGSTDRAVVLVFLDQTVTNTAQKSGPTTDQSRVSITLTRAHAAWVIDQVRLL